VNLLVTNTRNAQAYSIIVALRPIAAKVVVTMYGTNRLAARLSHAANSRLIDKRYYVPCPKSYLPQGEEDLKRIADELRFPLVIKPRFTAAGRGTAIVGRGLYQ
jgi:carbamoylphosphate synthase large subunit